MPTKQIEREYVTPPVAALLIGSNPDTVLSFIESGELKATNLSKASRPRWRIAKADLQAFMDGRSNRATSKTKRQARQSVPRPAKSHF